MALRPKRRFIEITIGGNNGDQEIHIPLGDDEVVDVEVRHYEDCNEVSALVARTELTAVPTRTYREAE